MGKINLRTSTHYHINEEEEKGDMLPSYAPWGCLEASRRGVTLTTNLLVKMRKNLEIFWRASIHYLISALVEKGDMLPNNAPCDGLELSLRRFVC